MSVTPWHTLSFSTIVLEWQTAASFPTHSSHSLPQYFLQRLATMAQWVIDQLNARLQSRRDILHSLFSNEITTQQAAEDLATITESRIEELDPDSTDPTEQNCNSVIEDTWLVIYFHARDNPSHQDLLVEVLLHMSKLPTPRFVNGTKAEANGQKLWSELPEIRWIGREHWEAPIRMRAAPPWETSDRAQSIANFVNINAFLARQQATGLSFLDHSLLALWTFRAALEYPSIERAKMSPLDFNVPGAAVWIEIAGEHLFGMEKEFPHGGNQGRPGLGGPLWDGMYGFCGERWALWRRRFGELADASELEHELRDLSSRAEAKMKEIEAHAVSKQISWSSG
ncbi:hypothetical protein LTR78_008539 [Recurvomyces mirabilis]|uniref:Uncharacterized protein n=1 Tax=Recurvomyces mirabilis TaxID=574656 RepID=A0AAE0TQG5_9PEZI|nr:hypothetical protein LTR78_008539 [Recurvomyces mirabilis]KAK5156290.1 hypothetical protein LTS14_005178 [Recurvomyces mirabilis]